MSIRLAKPFCAAVARVRGQLKDRERVLFDLMCAAGQLGYRLPDDDINLRAASGVKDPRKRLFREFPQLRRGALKTSSPKDWARASERVARLLLTVLDVKDIDAEDRALRILLAYAPIALAPDCAVPQDSASRAAWNTSVKLFSKLFPSTVQSMGPLDCVHRRLVALKRESRAGLRIGRLASGGRPGPEGRRLSVDPELIASVGQALGKKMAPGYMARHLFYARAGDHIWPHPDDPKFAVTVLVCIRHEVPPGLARRSAFVAYPPNGSIKRYDLAPGSALAVEPGMIHAREPVAEGERVALLSIGLVEQA